MRRKLLGIASIVSIMPLATGSLQIKNIQQSIVASGKTYTRNVCSSNDTLAVKIRIAKEITDKATVIKASSDIKKAVTASKTSCSVKKTLIKPKPKPTVAISQPSTKDLAAPIITIKYPEVLDAMASSERQKRSNMADTYKNKLKEILPQFYTKGYISKEAYNLYVSKELSIIYVNNCKDMAIGSTFANEAPASYIYTDKERQYYYGTNFWINICNPQTLTFDVSHTIIHEFGHFVYYVIDKKRTGFTNLCWGTNTKMISDCARDNNAFFTQYARSTAQEDYAESFTYWYLQLYDNAMLSAIQKQKLAYFTTLLKK